MTKRFQVKFRIKSDPKSTSRSGVNATMVTASNMFDARNQVKGLSVKCWGIHPTSLLWHQS